MLAGGALPGTGLGRGQPAGNQVLSVESALGYGFGVFEGQGVLTPTVGYASTGPGQTRLGVGVSYVSSPSWGNELRLQVQLGREQSPTQPALHQVDLQLSFTF